MNQETVPKLESLACIDVGLERHVPEMNPLAFCDTLHFEEIPSVFSSRHQDVGPGECSRESESQLEQRPPRPERRPACSFDFLGVCDPTGDLHALREKRSGQRPNFWPLVKDRLQAGVRRRNLISRFESGPQQLFTPESSQESRLRNRVSCRWVDQVVIPLSKPLEGSATYISR